MDINFALKKYQGKMEHTYTLGAFPTIELLKHKPECVYKVLLHPDMDSQGQLDLISSLCQKHQIALERNKKEIEKIRDKDNCLAVGVLKKYEESLQDAQGHIVLVHPSDMGNMGTIIRTAIGFGINDIAVIEPAVDLFHPKVIRASMGALFQLRFHSYASFEDYQKEFCDRVFYPFMLKGATDLQKLEKTSNRYSLIFGNEATGLKDEFATYGQSVFIRHLPTIDSLNLSMAVGIALYEFTK